jgi:hypothetical protein
MPKGVTFTDKEQAKEFAKQFPRSEVKRVGFWPFAKFVVYVNESELRAENYRRQLKGLPNLEDEVRAERRQE